MKKVLMLIMSCVAAISFIGCSAANPQSATLEKEAYEL
jgi:hypothetical protein